MSAHRVRTLIDDGLFRRASDPRRVPGGVQPPVHRVRPAPFPRRVRGQEVIRRAGLENKAARAGCAHQRRGEQRQGQGGGDPGADPGGRGRRDRRRRPGPRIRRAPRAREEDPRGDPIARVRTRRARDGGAIAPPRRVLRRALTPARSSRHRQVRARAQAQRGVRRRVVLRAPAHQVLRTGGALRPPVHARS